MTSEIRSGGLASSADEKSLPRDDARIVTSSFDARRECKRRTLATIAIASLLLATTTTVSAQMFVARNSQLGPMVLPDSGPFLGGPVTASMEMQDGSGSAGNEQKWNTKSVMSARLAQLPRRVAFGVYVGFELNANPYSSTNFNPRGLVSEPAMLLSARVKQTLVQLSLFHRCRHDIDNLDTPNQYNDDTTRFQRNVILSGVQVQLASVEMQMTARSSLRIYGNGELFSHQNGESRTPGTASLLDWDDARGAMTIGARARLQMRAGLESYARGWMNVVRFERTHAGSNGAVWRTNNRAEAGVQWRTATSGGGLFIAHERTFDDFSPPVPRTSRTLFVGARIGSNTYF